MYFNLINVYSALVDKIIPNSEKYGISEVKILSCNTEFMIDVMCRSDELIKYVIEEGEKDHLSKKKIPMLRERFGVNTTYNPLFFPDKISSKEEDDGFEKEYDEPDLIACRNRIFDRLLEEPMMDVDVILDSREFKVELLTRKIKVH